MLGEIMKMKKMKKVVSNSLAPVLICFVHW